MLLLDCCICSSCRLRLSILVVILRVRVVLPVRLVWVLVREGDVLHGHLGRLMQSPAHRNMN